MNFGANALSSIISSSFDGKKNNLALASGLLANVITKLTSGQSFTPQTLNCICEALTESDARTLCAAVCRDLVPEKFSDVVTNRKSGGEKNQLPPLDHETESTILNLAELCSRDAGTREWLHQLSTWMFPK